VFSPQAYCLREKKGQAVEMAIQSEHALWRVNMKDYFKIYYDSSFLPRMMLFHAVKAAPTSMALQSVIRDSNINLSLQKVWMRWHIKLGHLSFSHDMKLALGGFLDLHALGLERNLLVGQPKCSACRFGKLITLQSPVRELITLEL
jgi:hypothetical protein